MSNLHQHQQHHDGCGGDQAADQEASRSLGGGGCCIGPSGPPGEHGPTGERGPDGAQGNLGPEGYDGPMGLRGDPGPRGQDGGCGLDGPPGAPGGIGCTGQPGCNGQPGTPGPFGQDGQTGPEGVAGVPVPGPPGPRGNLGPLGEIGNPGPQGREGCVGQFGAAGIPGLDGLSGPQGDGDSGPAGTQGVIGTIGGPGLDCLGVEGPPGLTGPTGDPGTEAGIIGVTGNQGPQGAGILGPQGPPCDLQVLLSRITSLEQALVVCQTVSQPSPPLSVVVMVDQTMTMASISFTPPASDGGSPITGYHIITIPDGITTQGPSSPLMLTGLTPYTFYTFEIRAVNVAGHSLPHVSQSIGSLPTPAPTPAPTPIPCVPVSLAGIVDGALASSGTVTGLTFSNAVSTQYGVGGYGVRGVVIDIVFNPPVSYLQYNISLYTGDATMVRIQSNNVGSGGVVGLGQKIHGFTSSLLISNGGGGGGILYTEFLITGICTY